MTKSTKTWIFLATLIILSGCSFPKTFKVIINQGNLVDEEMLEKLEIGMTDSQVRYIMGTPLINDTFYPERWDYYTSITQGDEMFTETKITLYFAKGLLVKWEGGLSVEELESK
tara:strand:- start:92 stop:433 length:342 start_codon:yes stop_codon:yes gene_type:complete